MKKILIIALCLNLVAARNLYCPTATYVVPGQGAKAGAAVPEHNLQSLAAQRHDLLKRGPLKTTDKSNPLTKDQRQQAANQKAEQTIENARPKNKLQIKPPSARINQNKTETQFIKNKKLKNNHNTSKKLPPKKNKQ